jgi:hypothetical protein
MDISLRYIGGNPAKIIEFCIESNTTTIKEDITNMDSKIDPEFINNLREIADDLELQNKLIDETYS